ncbi:iron chaperone [Arcanobacterium canis]
MATVIAQGDEPLDHFFADWLATIPVEDNRQRALEVLQWVKKEFPQLGFRFAWRQPMFTDHGTFIIGFSPAREHLAFAPEGEGVEHFAEEFEAAGLSHGTRLVRLRWDEPVPWDLLRRVIEFQIVQKADTTSFWRK